MTTDANGDFTFLRLAEGNYVVREVTPYGWMQTLPEAPDFRYTVPLGFDQHSTNKDFGNFNHAPTDIWLSNDTWSRTHPPTLW